MSGDDITRGATKLGHLSAATCVRGWGLPGTCGCPPPRALREKVASRVPQCPAHGWGSASQLSPALGAPASPWSPPSRPPYGAALPFLKSPPGRIFRRQLFCFFVSRASRDPNYSSVCTLQKLSCRDNFEPTLFSFLPGV